MNHKFNAYLQYNDVNVGLLTYNMWVMRYAQVQTLGGTKYQSKMYSHFYPKSYAPGDLTVIGRVPAQVDYDNLGEFIRGHHNTLMAGPGLSNASNQGGKQIPLMELVIEREGVHWFGLIKSFNAGAKRFNVAPEFTLTFFIVQDKHTTSDIVPEQTLQQWWSGQWIASGGDNGNPYSIDPGTGAVISRIPGLPGGHI